ncbi:Methylated-DNA--protein-cysteine methyltransferase [hydrothermal vent metagenome]|uniref:methylated-DNA--[protein]-cysteine S-methyltransferase n=1 Tax=hydrothermal vent metagenome TaxID=652676 RepID=A0A3B0X1G0_9ZZZZ
MMIQYQYFNTPFGELKLASFNDNLIMCDWRHRTARNRVDQRLQKNFGVESLQKDNEILSTTRQQLNEYFTSTRKQFTLPIQLIGTDFQKKVWHGLMKIPYGKTCSYLELATQLAQPSAVRAVANANGANALSIIVPCHRIITNTGSLGGYAGGLPAKAKLLDLEK